MIDFASIGSVNNYLKNMGMQQNWNRKQQTGNFQPDGAKTVSQWVEKQKQSIKEAKKEPKEDKLLNDIKNKLSSGSRLLDSELKYLQKNDFETYKQAKAAETERNIYERELRMCRTKEDVQKYKMAHTARALENVKSAMNSSGGSKEDKLGAVMGEQKKMSAINAAEKDFVKSGEYSKLPSQAEKLKAERDLKRAKKEESRAAAEKRKERKAAEQAHAEKIRQNREEQKARLEKKKKVKRLKKNKKFKATKAKYTTAQALNTTEARKVRRANAKAAYEQSSMGIVRAFISSAAKDMDIRA